VPTGYTIIELSEQEWEEAQLIVKQRTTRDPPADFRRGLNDALSAYVATDYLQVRGSPKQGRRNLERTRATALRLQDCFNALDGNSRQLLSESSADIIQLYDLLGRIFHVLVEAEKKARELPQTKAGIRDFAPLNMGYYLAVAISRHVGTGYNTSSHNSLFADLFALLARKMGRRSNPKAVRAALSFTRSREIEEGRAGPMG
jgi:hypothetical protein